MFDLITGILEILASWRFYLCMISALALTWLIHEHVQREDLAWMISIPLLVFAGGLGLHWENRQGK